MQILNAYIALFAISAGVIAYDSYERQESAAMSAAEVAYAAQPKAPLAAPKQIVKAGEVQEVAEVKPTVAATPKKAQAPYGVFFLKNAVEVPTADGSRTFRAGARVQFVRRMDGKVKVTRDGTDFTVEESELTSSADDAAAIKIAANKPATGAANLYREQMPK